MSIVRKIKLVGGLYDKLTYKVDMDLCTAKIVIKQKEIKGADKLEENQYLVYTLSHLEDSVYIYRCMGCIDEAEFLIHKQREILV